MEFTRKTIQELLTAGNRYKVPDYQRGYAWKNLQVQDLWTDINEATADDPLYLGTLILQKIHGLGSLRHIVDGQQRITTICLLLIACRNIAKRNDWPQAETLSPLVAFHDIATGQTSGLRVEVGQNIAEAYEYLVRCPEWDEVTFPENIDGRKARILKKNYLFLREQLDAFNQQDLTDLLEKILNLTFFLVVDIEEALQAFDIFERTNARGTPLNIADLLKNMMFANSTLIPNLSERWDYIVETSDTMLPRILKYFDALSNGHDTGRHVLFTHLRRRADTLGPGVFMHEIEIFSRFFNSVVNHTFTRDVSERISDDSNFDFLYGDETFFKRVKRSLDALALFRVYVALPTIYAGLSTLRKLYASTPQYGRLKSEYLKTLSIIESFHFINNGICTTPTNRAEQLYAVAAKEIYAAKTAAKCREQLRIVQDGLKEIGIADKSRFEDAFSEIAYSPSDNKPMIAYIFDRMHQGPFVTSPTLAIYDPQSETIINRTYEVEHIAPIATWTGDGEVLNNIGNLLILTMETNRSVGQSELLEKVKIYKSRHCDNLQPVKDFVNFVENENIATMGPEIISKRARSMAQKAYCDVWNPWPEDFETTLPI